ncbi:conserved hypothetical protein [Burkholderia sp. 8Y]|uniref:hypothetical protein n=1 Tax=Burkholderia sp. 8Y TaxID=2653133 RepID=UPI0012F004E6|nr:hypothetical protein [Burkholderia sp. 8Y]VXC88483.1 conserved hypothetical protein [Burkholderia sp. 8Y]
MQATTLVSLRAHAMLIALCVAASDAAWLAVCGCSGHLYALQSIALRMATLVSAAGVMLVVRRIAKLAFDAANSRCAATHHRDNDRDDANGWLVQLHLELHPAESRRRGVCRCHRAARSARSPRGRA